jgi:hypothetical protein
VLTKRYVLSSFNDWMFISCNEQTRNTHLCHPVVQGIFKVLETFAASFHCVSIFFSLCPQTSNLPGLYQWPLFLFNVAFIWIPTSFFLGSEFLDTHENKYLSKIMSSWYIPIWKKNKLNACSYSLLSSLNFYTLKSLLKERGK